jgi:DNA polymerase-3 subunit alpha
MNKEALDKRRDGESVCVGGVITSVKNIIQRNNGKPMAFIKIEDFDGAAELVVFAESYGQYSHLCALDSMILARGVLQKKDGDSMPKIIVEKMLPLSEAREKLTRSVHIKLRTQGLEEDFIREIYSLCAENKGSCRLIIHIVSQESNEYRISSGQIQINPGKEVIALLRSKLGSANVWLSQKEA